MPVLTEFAGLPVVEFPARGTEEERITRARERGGDPRDPGSVAWRLRYDGEACAEHVARFLSVVDAERVGALVVGDWDASGGGQHEITHLLAEHADALPNLRSVFLGDIDGSECELSWIEQSDLAPLLAAFPRLEELTVRGADGIMGGELGLHVPSHDSLRSLTVETGGLPGRVVREVASSGLPALEHLELWLGMMEYGCDAWPSDLEPVLSGEAFPRLTCLGVCNAETVDGWVMALADAPVVRRLEVLDLSLGVLTDRGGQVLVDRAAAFAGLRRLDLHHHYLSEEMEEQVRAAFAGTGVEVDLSERLEPEYDEDGDEPYYYTAESE
ncbi:MULTISPECIES: STM4015 family protein [Nocardiopsis]|uniref:Cytoplasmic protein n=1 Tax=Nocardiopsis sinuspersici TaxID=501010 RepID=A0A1V3BV36_9ACTN|nr:MULTISPECIES: STM4015 family protein [Nocardiopsis]OOC52537.1 hypothetical protein NOSIN_00715 [Nocardiopsis sinuspersici]